MKLTSGIAAVLAAALASWEATSAAQAAPAQPAPTVEPSSPASDQAPGSAPASPHVEPPKLVHFVEATYPEPERERGESATVVLTIAIDAEGKVVDATIERSAGEAFDASAIAAVKQFEFEPARVDGTAVPVRIQYRYEFTLEPAAPPVPVKTTVSFSGTVRDRNTGQPLAGVRVELDANSTSTDELGRFYFQDVEPGTHAVTLSRSGFAPTGTQETFVSGQGYDVTYDVDVRPENAELGEVVDYELVIVDSQLQKSVAATTVSADQAARVAGTGGDAIKVVENLPGVARSSVGSGALVVWGAGAADTRVYVDDVHIPVLYHEGGYRSVIHPDLVQNVELEPGGYGAAHGRGLGGLVTIGLKPLVNDGYHGSVAVDAIDAAAAMRGNIGDHVRFAGAVRRSHLDWMLQQVTSNDVGEFVPIPRYWDGQLRAAWVPNEDQRVEVGGLFSSDRIQRTVVEADPSENKRDSKQTDFQRVYARYEQYWSDGTQVTLTPFFGLDHVEVTSVFGAVPARLTNDARIYGLRAMWTGKPESFVLVSAGLDIEAAQSSLTRSGSITTPPREGDIVVFGQAPSDQVNADSWTTTEAGLAPFVQADFAMASDRVHLIPGLRIEPNIVRASRRIPQQPGLPPTGIANENTFVEPRMAARWQIVDAWAVRGAVGIYHQPPLADDLSPVFGNPVLGPAKALQYLVGTNVRLLETLSVEATAFYSKQSDLVTRSPLPTPLLAQALIQDGHGRAYGAQVLVRKDLSDRLFGWLSYSIVRSQRTDGGSDAYRPFDFDQTHVLTALASYDLGAGFETGARFRFATGYPRTPVVGATYDARTDSFQPVFGAHNSIRIPNFYEFDVRIAKHFDFDVTTNLEIYLDVHNVTNQQNPEEIIYNFDYSRRSYITGLPILPVLGAKLTW